jgi:serine/threonine kinase 32
MCVKGDEHKLDSFLITRAVHIDTKGYFPENVARFWLAEIACGLAFLHERRIIHRDIKPDNILLDAAGHAHITDFNVATRYSSRRPHTSVGGTMAYMAPEIFSRRGYSWQVDWWSLGIVAYELLWHKRPFDGKTAEKMAQSVLHDPIVTPPCVVPKMPPISSEGCEAVLSVRT